MIKRVLVVGGANGIGLSIATEFAGRKEIEMVYIVDKASVSSEFMHPKFKVYLFDLTNDDYSLFDQFMDIDALMITAGFGKLALFKDVSEEYIKDSFNVNTIPALRLIHKFYRRLEAEKDFYCGVMVSISGYMSSPFFAVYGATKAALKIFIESVNVELLKSGSNNVILNISPGSFRGSAFYGKVNDLGVLHELSSNIIERLEAKDDEYIPNYESVYKDVLQRYHDDFRKEGAHSYDYKLNTKR